jgi:hypothetical protein
MNPPPLERRHVWRLLGLPSVRRTVLKYGKEPVRIEQCTGCGAIRDVYADGSSASLDDVDPIQCKATR